MTSRGNTAIMMVASSPDQGSNVPTYTMDEEEVIKAIIDTTIIQQ